MVLFPFAAHDLRLGYFCDVAKIADFSFIFVYLYVEMTAVRFVRVVKVVRVVRVVRVGKAVNLRSA